MAVIRFNCTFIPYNPLVDRNTKLSYKKKMCKKIQKNKWYFLSRLDILDGRWVEHNAHATAKRLWWKVRLEFRAHAPIGSVGASDFPPDAAVSGTFLVLSLGSVDVGNTFSSIKPGRGGIVNILKS